MVVIVIQGEVIVVVPIEDSSSESNSAAVIRGAKHTRPVATKATPEEDRMTNHRSSAIKETSRQGSHAVEFEMQ